MEREFIKNYFKNLDPAYNCLSRTTVRIHIRVYLKEVRDECQNNYFSSIIYSTFVLI